MKRPTFIGEDEVFIRSLISYAYRKPDISEDEFFSNRSIVKNHIDSGAALLGQLFQECGREADSLLRRLVDEVEFSGRREVLGHGLDIFIGRTLLQRNELIMETQQHGQACELASGHHGQAGCRENAVSLEDSGRHSHSVELSDQLHILRLQGRCGRQRTFPRSGEGSAIPTTAGQSKVSLSIRSSCHPMTSKRSTSPPARRQRALPRSTANLGVVQKGALTEAIRAAYARRAGSAAPYPDFHDVFEIASCDV